jgi:hypothetical protein
MPRRGAGEQLEAVDSGSIPAWAGAVPSVFWAAIDQYEKTSTYTEHEITLPRELNPEKRLALVQAWIAQEIGDRSPAPQLNETPRKRTISA